MNIDINPNQKFLEKVCKLKPVEFAGLAISMGIKIYSDDENKEPRDAYDILKELVEKYMAMPRKQRRNLLHNLNAGNT